MALSDNGDSLSNRERQGTTVSGNRKWSWLSTSAIDLKRLLELSGDCLFLNRYVAITSFDSASFRPSEYQIRGGWTVLNGVGYSPLIQATEQVPVAGWEELYVFSGSPILPNEVCVFVNNYKFSICAEEKAQTKAFWNQLAIFNPEACILDGALLHIISQDQQAVERIKGKLRKQEEL